MSDQSHSLNERQADRVESTQKQGAPSDSLMPSIDDYRNFNKDNSRQSHDACGPDYTFSDAGNGLQNLFPTQKRLDYDRQARESLNGPEDTSNGPASEKERESAAKVAELANKAQEDLKTSTLDSKRDEDIKGLVDIFKGLDPAAAQRVIAEANKLLGGNNLRFAQTPSGEVWMGSRDKDSAPYHLNARVKEAPCAPIA
ncbi:MAG: hypothetical protein QG625_497 [Cyanobacteriota bacterium erpe_2018_sw_39hr_WHONDRS-SW48-000098_B_bin.30]|jgi:hypothetical protein|nr:hypothetical protein [Cyanobacteriota bacterium erpe_2018_sw_39hr_WHONDRS-SW48-000098_B_bin.30]